MPPLLTAQAGRTSKVSRNTLVTRLCLCFSPCLNRSLRLSRCDTLLSLNGPDCIQRWIILINFCNSTYWLLIHSSIIPLSA